MYFPRESTSLSALVRARRVGKVYMIIMVCYNECGIDIKNQISKIKIMEPRQGGAECLHFDF
ncbi:hypothetical protein A3I42_01680 [Candidatus Uhrbacteria bacterium RIFCSPLOWO2_02_FULL_49_11]|uniref:Uncharacterized protein n=1 Tax=Candidatus Uhrbacteria bacterium RIFCSPLOWO2_02_FULL_49_11 TaxID=1802409 RepID=A0A1F7VE49_9BACT|nr:MAG: hypothetical protein A3I42_01680 [Candidatus Uhrbacteria bacterium RIFCSPLOWO2_02_FULL_49_11]